MLDGAVTNAVVATFNDLDSVELRFKQNQDKIAAVILEPVMMNLGVCLPQPGFLRGLRELCTRNGALLIFDEVKMWRPHSPKHNRNALPKWWRTDRSHKFTNCLRLFLSGLLRSLLRRRDRQTNSKSKSATILVMPILGNTMPRSTTTRLTQPLVRENGSHRPATWDEAMNRVAAAFRKSIAKNDPRDFGMFSCSKTTNELNYAAQKFVRSVIGTNNIDSCNRT